MPYSLGGWGILHWVPDVLSGPFQRLEVAHVALPRAQEYFRDLSLDKGVLTTKGKNVKGEARCHWLCVLRTTNISSIEFRPLRRHLESLLLSWGEVLAIHGPV